MSWNYRVCHRPSVTGGGYEIHEVYYDEDGSVKFYSSNPCPAHGDIVDELYLDMKMMMDALDLDPIDLDKLDKKFAENKTQI